MFPPLKYGGFPPKSPRSTFQVREIQLLHTTIYSRWTADPEGLSMVLYLPEALLGQLKKECHSNTQECSKETPNNKKITQKVDFPGKNGKFQSLKCQVWKTTGANRLPAVLWHGNATRISPSSTLDKRLGTSPNCSNSRFSMGSGCLEQTDPWLDLGTPWTCDSSVPFPGGLSFPALRTTTSSSSWGRERNVGSEAAENMLPMVN